MKITIPAWIKLTLITVIAGLLLGCTYMLTKGHIAAQTLKVAEESRKTVFASADSFNELEVSETAPVDNCYEAIVSGSLAGYVSTATVKGYGGEIEVTVGVDLDGMITGVSVGGANFSETAGLGAKTKDAAFTDQYKGLVIPVELTKDGGRIDSVTGATISSRAVTNAVNTAVEYILYLF
ncbi:MAG: RnfABCDGE type electron transport complex subunit G [Clostridia bacterium]|nr:RnfABCDGE type electron transport complex subunit G [Clostridia bacterium]